MDPALYSTLETFRVHNDKPVRRFPATEYADPHNLIQHCPEQYRINNNVIEDPYTRVKELVYGKLNNKAIVVKTSFFITSQNIAERGKEFTEALVDGLKNWKSLSEQYPNIATVIGLTSNFSSLPSLVMPHYENGNIVEYLKIFKEQNNRHKRATQLLRVVASALAHLHSQNPPIAHERLKANNILIDETGEPYLSDIGLAQYLAGTMQDYQRRSPQELCYIDNPGSQDALTSPEEDVYRFGMTMFEVYTGGKSPHSISSDKQNMALLADALKGDFPVFPVRENYPAIPDAIWGLMKRCWAHESSDRPRMEVIKDELESLHEQ